MSAAPAARETSAILPRLRDDIVLELAPQLSGGFPGLVVTDPVRGSYFRLAWPASAILLHWQEAGSLGVLQEVLRRTYGLDIAASEIEAVTEFAFSSQLTQTDPAGTWKRYAAVHAAGKHSLLKSAMHSYLFFRIPLFHPEAWLRRLTPAIAVFYTRTFWLCLLALALAGLYLAMRQWTQVEAAVADALKLEGLLLYAAAVLGLKVIHELGHAFTTVRYGCRVPSMGLAFMLGAPVLYTDTSDSWRLSQRGQRLAIVFAGVAAELIVATLALILWVLLPDGAPRSTCFALATTSLILSLAVNLNPFMRFDGYFALSDALDVANLQPRAFALGAWRLRELLFNLGHSPPEPLTPVLQRGLILYAYMTWIYRLFLYLGIAVLVYVMAGKALEIFLGLFELVFFIALPIQKELTKWWAMRTEIARPSRIRWTGGAVAGALVLVCAPWLTTVDAPSVLVAGNEEAVHLPIAARLIAIEVTDGQRVEAGQVLFRADTRDLDRQFARATIERRSLEMQRNRLHVSDKELDTRLIIESKLAQALQRLAAIEHQRALLVVRAPFAGVVADLDPTVSAGLWLGSKQPLARIVSDDAPKVRGLVSEIDIARISAGSLAVFLADDPMLPKLRLRLASIAPASDGRLLDPVLADRHGGVIAAGEEKSEMRTRQGWFEVTFEASGARPAMLMRGVARVEAAAASPLALVWRQVSRVLVREQGV